MTNLNEIIITALVSLISGGGLMTIIKIFIEHNQAKLKAQDKNIDDRIAAWQKISEKNESKLEQLERKMESQERDIRSLEKYIQSLELIIMRAAPSTELPDRPVLEREKI